MSAVMIPAHLVPIARTNADWEMDIAFSGEDWTGSQVSVIFGRQGLPPHAFEATIGDGLLPPTADLAVALRIPAAVWADAPPAAYTVQVRRLKEGAIDDAATFRLTLERGLTGLLTAPASAPAMSGAGDVVGSVLVSRIGEVQVARGGGTQGRSAYQIALANGFVGTEEEWAASLYAPSNAAAQAVFDKVAPLGGGAPGRVIAWFGPGETDYGWVAAADAAQLGAGLHVRLAEHGAGTGDNWVTAKTLPAMLSNDRDAYLRSDEGSYAINAAMNALVITSGGTALAPKVIGGRDRYGAVASAVFAGTRDAYPAARAAPTDPEVVGYDGFTLAADHVTLAGLAVNDVRRPIVITGNRAGVVIDGVSMTNIETAITNLDTAFVALGAINGLTIRNFSLVGAGVRGIDLSGATNVVIEDGLIDGQLQSYTTTQQGVHCTGATSGVVVRRVVSRNNVFYSSNPNQYANGGDGFCDERGCSGMVYEDCEASGNSDGGFDLKSVNPMLIRTNSHDNKYSYRLWDTTGTLIDARSVNPVRTLGTGSQGHFQFNAPPTPGLTRTWTLTRPYIRGDSVTKATVFENGGAVGDPLVINITDYDIVIDPDAPLLVNASGGSVTINWNPPLPVTPAFTLTWRAGFEGGVIPVATAAGTVVADAAITAGAGVLSIKGGNGLLVAVGLTLVVGAIPAGGVIQEMTIRVAPASGLVKADKLISVLVPSPTLHADFSALLARITVPPSATRQALMNTAISTLAAAGVWALYDNLHVRAAPDAQTARLSWKGVAGDTTGTVGAPTFTPDLGVGGVGAAAYWTGPAPAVNRTLENAHIFAFALGASVAAGVDVANGSSPNFGMSCRSGSSAGAFISSGASSTYATAVAPPGAYLGVRDGPASVLLYQNNALNVTRTTASTVLPVTTAMRYGASARMLAIDSDGPAMNATQALANYTTWRAYLIFIGALTA